MDEHNGERAGRRLLHQGHGLVCLLGQDSQAQGAVRRIQRARQFAGDEIVVATEFAVDETDASGPSGRHGDGRMIEPGRAEAKNVEWGTGHRGDLLLQAPPGWQRAESEKERRPPMDRVGARRAVRLRWAG